MRHEHGKQIMTFHEKTSDMIEAFGLDRDTATSAQLYTVYRNVYEYISSSDAIPEILRKGLAGAVTEAYDQALNELSDATHDRSS